MVEGAQHFGLGIAPRLPNAILVLVPGSQPTKAELHALYLTPEVLGKKFGARLMELMLEKAKSGGAKVVTLTSSITAHEFYKRFGFVDSGPMRKVEIGGFPVTAFPMELRL